MNIEHFEDLPDTIKDELLEYISHSYANGKSKHTAYGLKQHYTSTHKHIDYHVTSRCFMEAMVHSGYKATPIPDAGEPDWYFEVTVL